MKKFLKLRRINAWKGKPLIDWKFSLSFVLRSNVVGYSQWKTLDMNMSFTGM